MATDILKTNDTEDTIINEDGNNITLPEIGENDSVPSEVLEEIEGGRGDADE